MENQQNNAIVYCEGNFGKMDGKTANGLVRFSNKYKILGVIDSTLAGKDSGEYLDNEPNGIMIYKNMGECLELNKAAGVDTFIYGMAPLSGSFSKQDESIIAFAMESKLNVVNGLHEFLTNNEKLSKKAEECGVTITDIRKPKPIEELSVFTGDLFKVTCPKIAILGTDSAVGKRTTSTILNKALRDKGLNSVMIATGQTGLIQGAKYGVSLDAIPEQFISGEMESAVFQAWEVENPDLMIIEGQGSLSHPAYLSSCFIVRGSQPDAIIVQHPPKRVMLGDYDMIKMPTLESEIALLESFSGSPVIGITINHENMTNDEVSTCMQEYENSFKRTTTDVLLHSCDTLIDQILESFPQLKTKIK